MHWLSACEERVPNWPAALPEHLSRAGACAVPAGALPGAARDAPCAWQQGSCRRYARRTPTTCMLPWLAMCGAAEGKFKVLQQASGAVGPTPPARGRPRRSRQQRAEVEVGRMRCSTHTLTIRQQHDARDAGARAAQRLRILLRTTAADRWHSAGGSQHGTTPAHSPNINDVNIKPRCFPAAERSDSWHAICPHILTSGT